MRGTVSFEGCCYFNESDDYSQDALKIILNSSLMMVEVDQNLNLVMDLKLNYASGIS